MDTRVKRLNIVVEINGGEYESMYLIEGFKKWEQLDNSTVLVDGIEFKMGDPIKLIELERLMIGSLTNKEKSK